MSKDIVAEMTDAAFQQWRHHPVTRAFLDFMEDQAKADREAVMGLWETGVLSAPPPHLNPEMLRGRVAALKETAAVSLGAIKAFYGIEEQPQDTEKTRIFP